MGSWFFNSWRCCHLDFFFLNRKWLFVQFSGGPYSKLRPAGLRGKACHCSDCVNLYEMSLSGVLRRALRSTTCGSPATVPGLMLFYCWILEKSRKNVRSTVLTVCALGCCLAWIMTCVYSAGQNICLSRSFLSIAACTLSISIQVWPVSRCFCITVMPVCTENWRRQFETNTFLFW